jgi:hypothetical protein
MKDKMIEYRPIGTRQCLAKDTESGLLLTVPIADATQGITCLNDISVDHSKNPTILNQTRYIEMTVTLQKEDYALCLIKVPEPPNDPFRIPDPKSSNPHIQSGYYISIVNSGAESEQCRDGIYLGRERFSMQNRFIPRRKTLSNNADGEDGMQFVSKEERSTGAAQSPAKLIPRRKPRRTNVSREWALFDTDISSDDKRIQPDSEFLNGSVNTEQYRAMTAQLESIGHIMTNNEPQTIFHESSERLQENRQLSSTRPDILIDDHRRLHDDSMLSGDEYNPGPSMNQSDLGGQGPNSLPQISGTPEIPGRNTSDGTVNVNQEKLGNVRNCPGDSCWSNVCSEYYFNDPTQPIPHWVPGVDDDMDFIKSDSYIPSVDQAQFMDDLIYSSTINDGGFREMFCKAIENGDICEPYGSCSRESICGISYDLKPDSRIQQPRLGHSEMQPNGRAMSNHCNHYQYDNQARAIQLPDFG